jgi:hypothetical protein
MCVTFQTASLQKGLQMFSVFFDYRFSRAVQVFLSDLYFSPTSKMRKQQIIDTRSH